MNGNLKEIIKAMIEADTDCCEVTNTVGDISVTLDITITKIVKAGGNDLRSCKRRGGR